jgi:hypothetical protein
VFSTGWKKGLDRQSSEADVVNDMSAYSLETTMDKFHRVKVPFMAGGLPGDIARLRIIGRKR